MREFETPPETDPAGPSDDGNEQPVDMPAPVEV